MRAKVGEGVRHLGTRDEGAAKRVGAGTNFLREGHGGGKHHRRAVHDSRVGRIVEVPDVRRRSVDERRGFRVRAPAGRQRRLPFPARRGRSQRARHGMCASRKHDAQGVEHGPVRSLPHLGIDPLQTAGERRESPGYCWCTHVVVKSAPSSTRTPWGRPLFR